MLIKLHVVKLRDFSPTDYDMAFNLRKRYCAKCIHDGVNPSVISDGGRYSTVSAGSVQLQNLQMHAHGVNWLAQPWGGRKVGEFFLHSNCVNGLARARDAAAELATAAAAAAAGARIAHDMHAVHHTIHLLSELLFYANSCARIANLGAHDGCKPRWAPSLGS